LKTRLYSFVFDGIPKAAITLLGLVFLSLLALNIRNFQHYTDSVTNFGYHFVVPVALATAAFAALRLSPPWRWGVTLSLLSCVVALYTIEIYLGFVELRPARADGRPFDGRTKIEVIADLRRDGVDAYPTTRAKNLLAANANGALVPVLSDQNGGLLPLASLPGKNVVVCNETGQWLTYRADAHGFHNPPGSWTGEKAGTVLVGDSFVQGNCVGVEENIAARLRQDGTTVLNLGVDGSGPLVELAVFREYVEAIRPDTVISFYCEGNDLTKDLSLEMKSDLLRGYARDGDFQQELARRKDEVAARLQAYLDPRMAETMARVDHPWERMLAAAKLFRLRGRLGLGPVSLGVVEGAMQEQFTLFRDILAAVAARTALWGGRLVFVYLPESDRYFGANRDGLIRAHIRDRVLSIATALELPIVDVAEAFAESADPRALFVYPGSHYNAAGYALAAQTVQDELARRVTDAR
jgi:hypothetical protein